MGVKNKDAHIARVILGNSDYTRDQMVNGDADSVWAIGDSASYFLNIIQSYEDDGYVIKFETSFIRKLFGVGKYKVIAYKYYK
jgi:hypothetical protein